MEALRNPWFIAPFVVGVVGLIALVFTFCKVGQVKPGRKAGLIDTGFAKLVAVDDFLRAGDALVSEFGQVAVRY